jgi:hypothetical protein
MLGSRGLPAADRRRYNPRMPPHQRILILGCIALGFAVLLAHAGEPIRLNLGDPWSEANVLTSIKYVNQYGFLATSFTDILDVGPLTADSYRYIHYPPLSEIIYGALSKYLGVDDITTFRWFAIGFSGLAMWLLYHYVRRLHGDRVALLATALWCTSLFWLMYGDSMHQTPILHAATFLALWGLVRAIETRRRRHYAAAFFGSLACFLTSYDHWLFLPAAVLVTVYLTAGNPFARGNRHFVVCCALGCVAGVVAKSGFVIGAVGWPEFLADIHFQFLERSTSAGATGDAVVPTLTRRITLVFTPFVWIPVGYFVIQAARASSWTALVKDSAAWLLAVAIAFLWLFRQLAASQMLASGVVLPFYAIGSALVIDRLLRGGGLRQLVATGWFLGASAWSFGWFLTSPRALLERGDVARTVAYLAEHDRNDFLLSNLKSDGHIQAFFERHSWGAPDLELSVLAPRAVLTTFDRMGTDRVHVLVFTDPASRFIDKALWPMAVRQRQWWATGWPHLWRDKTRAMIADADARVVANLAMVGAERVLRLTNFDVYRLDKASVLARAYAEVPVARVLDFGGLAAERHKLLGWSEQPELFRPQNLRAPRVVGRFACPRTSAPNACKTVLTKLGNDIRGNVYVPAAQLVIRVDHTCGLALGLELAAPAMLRLTMNQFAVAQRAPARQLQVVIPRDQVTPGINVIELENLAPLVWRQAAAVARVTIDPACAAGP